MPWKTFVNLDIKGEPKAQPRVKACNRGKHAGVYTPSSANGWKELLILQAKKFRPPIPFSGPMRVDCQFLLPRPKRLYRKKDADGRILHTAKPDRDNLDKAVLDCLTQMGYWRDDSQVCGGRIEKYYHGKGESPGVLIRISIFKGRADGLEHPDSLTDKNGGT